MARFVLIGIGLGMLFCFLDHLVSGNATATSGELGLRAGVLAVCLWAGYCAGKTFTTNKRTDEQLRASYALFQAVMENTSDAIFVKDRVGRYLTCNTACAEFLGKTVEEVSGKTDFEVFPKESATRIHEVDQRAISEGKASSYEEDLQVAGYDEIRHFLSIKAPFRDEQGNITGLIGIARDITDRKKAERALHDAHKLLDQRVKERTKELAEANQAMMEKERQMRLMTDALPALIAYIGRDQRYRFANLAYKRFHMITDESALIGKEVVDVVGEKAFKTIESDIQKALSGKNVLNRIEVERKDGSKRLLEGCLVPHILKNGKTDGYYVLVYDITEQAEAEDLVRQQRQELAHVSRVNALGELTASMAHELNQPLTSLLCNAQTALHMVAADQPDPDVLKELLEDIIQDDKRAADIIYRLRALSRKNSIVEEDIQLNGLIKDVIQLVNSDIVIRNITIQTRLDPNLPSIQGDRVQLQQVLLNLILNGCEAMDEAPAGNRKLEVQSALKADQVLEVAVKDLGCGLSEKSTEELFAPFYTTKADGLGMGLSINKSIIEAHGGELWGRNNPDGKGATFGFTLPPTSRSPGSASVSAIESTDTSAVS